MKIEKWWLLGVAIVVVAGGVVSVSAAPKTFPILGFKKHAGVPHIQEGVEINLPSKADKLQVVDSIDPKSGQPAIKLKAKAGGQEAHKKTFVAEDSGKTLELPYVNNGKKDVAIYDPISSLQPVAIPGTEEYMVSFDDTIYQTDWKNGKLKKILKDQVDNYKKDDIVGKTIPQYGPLVWASRPEVSPKGGYLLFFSDRSDLSVDKNGQTWVKNLQTGDEKPLFSGSTQVVGWLDETHVVLFAPTAQGPGAAVVDLATGAEQHFDVPLATTVASGNLVYQLDSGSLTIQPISGGNKQTVQSPLLYKIGSIIGNGDWIAAQNTISNDVGNFNIVLYNVNTGEWKTIEAADGMNIEGMSWVDGNTLLVNTQTKGSLQEDTYTVDINQLEVAQ